MTSSLPNTLDPDRIRLARMRRGHTKLSLARALGVTDRTIHKYETGLAPLSTAEKLASSLNYPVAYFTRPLEIEIETGSTNYRAGRDTTSKSRNAAEAAGITGIEISQWIREHFTLPLLHVPVFGKEKPQLAAQMLREEWALGTKPLPNLVQLCESKGITVFGLPQLAKSVDAFSWRYDSQPYIYLSRQKTPERTRFDIAHELGHLVLHKNAEVKTTPEQEREADQFASEFLMPRSTLAEYLPRNATIDAILDAKNAFKVSALALTYTLHKNGYMTDWIYRSTCLELSQRGYRRGEPEGMLSHEFSRVFPQVLGADKGGTVTVGRIAEELALPSDDVTTLMMQPKFEVLEGDKDENNRARTNKPPKLSLVH